MDNVVAEKSRTMILYTTVIYLMCNEEHNGTYK